MRAAELVLMLGGTQTSRLSVSSRHHQCAPVTACRPTSDCTTTSSSWRRPRDVYDAASINCEMSSVWLLGDWSWREITPPPPAAAYTIITTVCLSVCLSVSQLLCTTSFSYVTYHLNTQPHPPSTIITLYNQLWCSFCQFSVLYSSV